MPLVLIDTNVLIYSFDQNDLVKQERALNVLEVLHRSGNATLSVQGLAEFVNAALNRLRPPMPPAMAFEQVARLARTYPILELNAPIVIEAARGVRDYKLSYYDAQLWATAKLYRVQVIFSEDFASNTTLESVAFVNPFAPDFDLAAWA